VAAFRQDFSLEKRIGQGKKQIEGNLALKKLHRCSNQVEYAGLLMQNKSKDTAD